jgi:metallophosphoesterase (TIGR03767 family)
MRRSVSVCLLIALGALLALPGSGNASRAGEDTGTTLDQTIVPEGDRDLGVGPGQARVTRALDWNDKKGKGRALAGFKQVSDIHALDEESPGRVEYFDGCSQAWGDLSSAYRPQESMTLQVGDSMIRQLNSITEGPATGVPLDFMISTGDNVDNNQQNELDWFINLLDGDTIDPNSGDPTYDGYSSAHASTAPSDEILALANQPFDPAGANVPWYGVIGNHDGLAQGNVLRDFRFNAVATGNKKVFLSPDTYDNCPTSNEDFAHLLEAFSDAYANDSEPVPGDAARELLTHENMIERYFDETTTKPEGHGFNLAPNDPLHPDSDAAGYYSFKIAKQVQGIVLDTVAYSLGSNGQVPDTQFQWLEKQLKKYSRVYYDEDGERRRNKDGQNKLLMIFSHHHSQSMHNTTVPDPAPDGWLPVHCFETTDGDGCADGEGLHTLLNRYPNVVAWVNGHSHANRVRPWEAPAGGNANRAFWEINTAAHIDWPQQSRLIEVAWKPGRDDGADTVFLYGTTVDHGAALDPDLGSQTAVDYLASLSRVESYFDACVREFQASCDADGTDQDKNVKLVQKAPFNLGN